jgi:cysteine desulfurase/selenocysteine lyase
METKASNSDPIEKFRASFHHSDELMHFNNAGVAPTSLPAFEAVKNWNQWFYENGFHGIGQASEAYENVRSGLAGILGAKAQEVAFFQSAAAAISQVAFGLKLNPGDEIVVWDQEYPSNYHPWRLACERTGAKLVVAQSGENFSTPQSSLEAVLTPKTRVIAFSWVQYRTGAITDLVAVTRIARSRNILTCADIIQGAGLLPFDFSQSGLDFACGGSHKWFVSPVSSGYLIAKQDKLELLTPLLVGAMTYGGPDSVNEAPQPLAAAASRFEAGSKAFLEVLALGASLKLLEDVGIVRISQEVEWLSKRLMHGLREIGYAIHSPHGIHHRGSIVNFTPTSHSRFKSVNEIAVQFNQAKISFSLRPPGVRLSPHAFNTSTEIDSLLSVLS